MNEVTPPSISELREMLDRAIDHAEKSLTAHYRMRENLQRNCPHEHTGRDYNEPLYCFDCMKQLE